MRRLPKHLIGRNTAPHPDTSRDVMVFGRAGAGAPRRGRGGSRLTSLQGHQEIRWGVFSDGVREGWRIVCRFQADESVQKTISNTMRYNTSRAEKDTYQQDLGRCR